MAIIVGISAVLCTAIVDASAQNSAAVVTVHTGVTAPNPINFGFNLQEDEEYITDNHWIQDGGFAPLQSRLSLTAESGTTNTFVDVAEPLDTVDGGTTSYDTIASGYYKGATAYTYRFTPGATGTGAWQLLRTDTVKCYTAVNGSTAPADHTITFEDDGPAIQPGDIVWLCLDNYPNIDLSTIATRRLPETNDEWNVQGSIDHTVILGGPAAGTKDPDTGVTINLSYTRILDGPPSDNVGNPSQSLPECLAITSSATQEIYLTQGTVFGPDEEGFEPGHQYTASVWLKETGGMNSDVIFTIDGLSALGSHTFSGANGTWQKFCWTFGAVGNGATHGTFRLDFTGQGTLEVDNFQLYDSTNGREPDSLDSRVLTSWQNFMPGTMRIWSGFGNAAGGGYTFWSLDSWLTSELKGRNALTFGSGYAGTEQELLPTALANCRLAGAQPWLIGNMSWNPQEWKNLIDYLCGPRSSPYGAMRPSTHPNPYTDDFDTIYIEFGNEEWGSLATTASKPHYGEYAHLMMAEAESNPNFNFSKIKFIVNGFSGEPGFGYNAIAAAPEASVVDFFNYTGGDASLTGNAYYQRELLTLPSSYQSTVDSWVYYENQSANASPSRPYTIAVYEGGPGSDNPNGGGDGDATLAAAVASLDVFLYGSQSGVGPQNFFLYALGTGAFSSHTNFHNGFIPHPIWEALQMRNQYCAGPMTSSEINTTPGSTDGNNYPLIGSYTFHDPAGNADVWVISRDVANSTPVTLHLPAAATGAGTLYILTGGANGAGANNNSGMEVSVTSQSVTFTGTGTGAGRDYCFTMPPSSAYLFVVPTGAWPNKGPTGLTANGYISQAFLNWTPVAGATSYNIYRSLSPGSEGYTPSVSGVIGTSFNDTGATAGYTYYYRITAVTSNGETDFSNEASAVTGPALGDSSFSSVNVGSNDYVYEPTGDAWSFTGDSGIVGNGSGWAPNTPDGNQAAYLQEIDGSISEISQTLDFPTVGTYSITLNAATVGGGGQTLNVTLDGKVVGTITPTSTTYASYTVSFDVNTIGNHILAFVSAGTSGNETDCITDLTFARTTISNGDFEVPNVSGYNSTTNGQTGQTGGYKYNVTGGLWTFTGNSGIQSNNSYFAGAPAPNGTQTAFIQNSGGVNGSFSQSIFFPAGGSYTISMQAAITSLGGQPINVTLDGNSIGTIEPTSKNFASYSTNTFTIPAPGSHALEFIGKGTAGADLIDLVTTNPVPINNGSFEVPALGADGAEANPPGGFWTFNGGSGIQNVGSSDATDGNQIAYLENNGGTPASISQSINFTTLGSYVITLEVAAGANGGQPINIIYDGNTIGTVIPSSTSFTSFASNSIDVVAPGTHTLVLIGTGTSGDLTDYVDSIAATTLPVSNGSFEAPNVGSGGFEYNPIGGLWTFTGDSGIQGNGSGWGAPPAPDGSQTAFLQQQNGTSGRISETINLPTPGSYQIRFQAAARSGSGQGGQPIQVTWDGTTIATIMPVPSFNSYTTNSITVTAAGNHVLAFTGQGTGVDQSDFIDSVKVVNAPITNGSFEEPANISPGGSEYRPTLADAFWTFGGDSSGIESNGSSWEVANAPDGQQAAFVGTGSGVDGTISQTVTFATAGTYAISMQVAAWAGWGGAPLNVTLNGTTIGTYTPPSSSSSFVGFTTNSFPISIPGTYTLMLAGTGTDTNKMDFIDSVSVITPPIANNSFETPSVSSGTPDYGPSGGSWTFTGNSGIQSTSNAPDGIQTAFLEKKSGAGGSMSQAINIPTPGSYAITLQVAAGANGGQPVNVILDGKNIGTITPSSTSFSAFTSTSFPITTAGAHTLTFGSAGTSEDGVDLIDTVNLIQVPVTDGGFETPSVGAGGSEFDPAGSFWTFTGFAGIQSYGSWYGQMNAPDGSQTAMIDQQGGYNGTIAQIVYVSQPGNFCVNLQSATRLGYTGVTFNVTIDGTVVGTITPTSTNFVQSSTGSFSIPAGFHTLALIGTGNTSDDEISLIDSVSISSVP